MEKKDENTLSGFHIRHRSEDVLKLHPKKYTWHIPKRLRDLNVQPGDIVATKTGAPILVTEVFREDIEDTGQAYQSIAKVYERAPREE